MASKIQLHSLATPNGQKVACALEELGLEYEAHAIDIMKGEQFSPEFTAINPNCKIPAIVGPNGPDDKPMKVFESGAILLYLVNKAGKLISQDLRLQWETIQWLCFQMAGVGPMFGQFGHFLKFAKEKCNHPYPLERYAAEAKRLLTVLEKRLERREFLVSEGYSIADIATCPWVDAMEKLYFGAEKLQLDKFENVVAWRNRCLARPASLKGIEVCPLSRSKPAS